MDIGKLEDAKRGEYFILVASLDAKGLSAHTFCASVSVHMNVQTTGAVKSDI